MEGASRSGDENDPRPSGVLLRQLLCADLEVVKGLAGGGASAVHLAALMQTHAAALMPAKVLAYGMAVMTDEGTLLGAALCDGPSAAPHECRVEIAFAFAAGTSDSPQAAALLECMVEIACGMLRPDQDPADGGVAAERPRVIRVTLAEDGAFAEALGSAGFKPWLLEHDLRRDAVVSTPPGLRSLEVRRWEEASAPLFFQAYEYSFRDRPGFPGWAEDVWRSFATGYATFRPDLSTVVVEDGKGVAFLIAAVERDGSDSSRHVGWVVQMGVSPSHRRQGIGRALLEHLSAEGAEAFDALMLSVNENNPQARGLYAAMGFEVHARRHVYRKVLPPSA